MREGARAHQEDYTVKRIAAMHRSRVNKMAHAVGQVVAERLKHRWMTALEKLLDDGAGYDDIVRYLDARAGAAVPFVRPEYLRPEPVCKPFAVEDFVPWPWFKESNGNQ